MHLGFYLTDHGWSGRARAFDEAVRGLTQRGVECSLVSLPGGCATGLAERGHEVVVLQPHGGVIRAAWRLSAVLRSRDIDVVFVHHEREALVAALAARMAGRGAVVRRVPPMAWLTSGRSAAFASRMAPTGYLFAFSDDLETATLRSRTLDAVVAPPAVTTATSMSGAAPSPATEETAQDSGTPASPFRVLVVAGESDNGRVLPILRAAALVAARGQSFTINVVGSALDADALRISAAALRIGERVQVADARTQATAVRDALKAASLAWVVAASDDSAFALLDAFAAGVPVMGERDALSQRMIGVAEAALLLPDANPASCAAQLSELMADAGRRGRLAVGGREVLRRFSFAAMVEGFTRAARQARDRAGQSGGRR